MEIDTSGLNTLAFHAYANKLHDEAFNLLLEYLPKKDLEGNEKYVLVYTTTISSFLSLKESLESFREVAGKDDKYYIAIINTIKDLMEDILSEVK